MTVGGGARSNGTAVVVGSGPNGLAGAVTLARAGLQVTVVEAADQVGGGLRSAESTLPGLVHDHCAGFHPLAVDNVFSRTVDLAARGVEWLRAPYEMSHPLLGGRGAVVSGTVAETAAGLGDDGAAWTRLFGRVADRMPTTLDEFGQPVLHLPRHPVDLALFGLRAAPPADVVARTFRRPETRALWLGITAHGFRPPSAPFTSAVGIALGAAAQQVGWPVVRGGSQVLADALVAELASYGGSVETGRRVTDLGELGGADVVLLDTSPRDAGRILGDRLAPRLRDQYAGWRHGVGAYQLALAVDGGVPWTHEPSRSAAVVHVGGEAGPLAAAARDVRRGRVPEHPFVLVGQQAVADPARGRGTVVPVDAYAHVPVGCEEDLTDRVLDELERYAPGLRERIVAMTVRPPAEVERQGINYVGGDISTGATFLDQLLLGPRPGRSPYPTGVPGVYLCSSATAPGPGAHGLCGYGAASAALRDLAD